MDASFDFVSPQVAGSGIGVMPAARVEMANRLSMALPLLCASVISRVRPMCSGSPPEQLMIRKKNIRNATSGVFDSPCSVHPFFDELPEWFVVRAGEVGNIDKLQSAIDMLTAESRQLTLGSETVTQALLDIIFMHILRTIVARRNAEPASWSHAVGNAQIRAALEHMHADCARDWTLDALASAVVLSRAGFAQKFKATLGATPLQYLTTVRIQKAMHLLADSSEKIQSVAQEVGYSDAFSFSKVFKKVAGLSPREYRLRNQQERDLPWRFQ